MNKYCCESLCNKLVVALTSDVTCFTSVVIYIVCCSQYIHVLYCICALHVRSTTTFHPDACAVMHDLLPKLENWKRCGE